jgi:hypothetical protein
VNVWIYFWESYKWFWRLEIDFSIFWELMIRIDSKLEFVAFASKVIQFTFMWTYPNINNFILAHFSPKSIQSKSIFTTIEPNTSKCKIMPCWIWMRMTYVFFVNQFWIVSTIKKKHIFVKIALTFVSLSSLQITYNCK